MPSSSDAPLRDVSTASVPNHGYRRDGLKTPLISATKQVVGEITRSRLRRTWRIWFLTFVAGVTLSWLGDGIAQQSFGLGVLIPGGGFLLHASGADALAHAGLFLGAVLSFLLALFIWVATGNLIAPVTVWVGTAVWSALMHQHHAPTWDGARILVPGLVIAVVLLLRRGGRRSAQVASQQRQDINHYLETSHTIVTTLNPQNGLPVVGEMPASSLPLMRFMLDRALQPVAEFNGFDRIDEFREAAKRYQICINSYSLSNQTYSHMPAFRGYMSEAQRRLSLKMQDHKVWKYWALENFWGNLTLDADPMPVDNIMYSGWYGTLLAMNQSNLGDTTFSQPGSIRLQHPSGKVFAYSFSDMCELMYRNFRKSDFCLFPCEPRWIYPMCNNFGGLALKVHDRLHGSHYWSDIEAQYRKRLEDEFITVNGRITAIRCYRTGVTVPGLTSAMADAAAAYYMNPLFPDLARRSWEIIRHELLDIRGGHLNMKTNGWDKIDFGNYKPSMISTYGLLAGAAKEMGDLEACDLLLGRLDNEYPSTITDGVQHYTGASTGAHFVLHGARNMRPNAIHDMINVGMPKPWADGPLLDKVSYPDVLVTKAVSDGRALDIVLHPGRGGGRHAIGLAQLQRGRDYRMTGATEAIFTADARGEATLTLDIQGRTPLLISPVQ
jgi:hypothetical protein